jgi:hypothetical protein
MANGEAISSKGVAMYLSVGGTTLYTVVPTAISKGKPTEVTAPPPAAVQPPVITVTLVGPPAAITTLTVSQTDYDSLTNGETVTFAGATGEWIAINGPHAVTKVPATTTITIPVVSTTFTDPVPAPGTVTGTRPGSPGAYQMGDIVVPRDTGFAELDGSYFVIQAVTAQGFTMLGADTSKSTGQLSPIPEMDLYQVDDVVKMCLSAFTFNLETPGTIPAGTYCNPSATLPAIATAVGTATLSGFIDKDDPAYQEVLKAEKDGLERVFAIHLPQAQGVIIAPMVITGTTWDIPLEGGMAYTTTGNLSAKPTHLF